MPNNLKSLHRCLIIENRETRGNLISHLRAALKSCYFFAMCPPVDVDDLTLTALEPA